jgi:hypothetical protein
MNSITVATVAFLTHYKFLTAMRMREIKKVVFFKFNELHSITLIDLTNFLHDVSFSYNVPKTDLV